MAMFLRKAHVGLIPLYRTRVVLKCLELQALSSNVYKRNQTFYSIWTRWEGSHNFCSTVYNGKPSFSSKIFTPHHSRQSSNDSTSSTSSKKLGELSPKLQILYTCKVCGSRNNHSFSRTSYEKGVVIVQCSGCKNNHLIADNLGWFDDIKERNIEEILASKGEEVKKITDVDIPQDILTHFENHGKKK